MSTQTNSQFKLRVDPTVLEWLKEKAKENCRSVTGEINARLIRSKKEEENLAQAA